MAYIGRTPTPSPLTSSDITDGIITTSKIADANITNPKLTTGSQQNFRNIIINGDMSIAQRGTSFSSTGDVYVLDRFKLDYAGSPAVRYTVTQDTDVPTGQGFAKSMKFDVTTAEASPSATTRLWTRLEAQNLQHLKYGTSNAESLTLSFWVKSNLTGTFIFWLYQEDGSNRSISKSYTINSANTWEKKTITIDGDASGQIDNDNGAGFRVVWFLTADQSAYGSSSLQTSWGSYDATAVATGQTNVGSSTSNEWYVTGVQLEVGTTASDFELIPFDVNLQRCQRYYYAHEDNVARVGRQLSNTECGYDLPFPNIMRTTPTVTYNSPSNDLVQVNGNNQSPTGYDSARSSFGTKSAFLALDYSSNSGGNNVSCKVILSHSATSKKEFDAEL